MVWFGGSSGILYILYEDIPAHSHVLIQPVAALPALAILKKTTSHTVTYALLMQPTVIKGSQRNNTRLKFTGAQGV
jgi:hypothetical protein